MIGCGNIGQFLIEMVNRKQKVDGVRIVALLDEREHAQMKLNKLAEEYGCTAYDSFDQFIAADMDLVVEAANIESVRQYIPEVLKQGKDALLISVGALADQSFYQSLRELAKAKGVKIYLPSGAIGGLDMLKAAASLGQVEKISLTTRKPPLSLIGKEIIEEQVVYSGSAALAIKQFPKNINVSIILSLAGLGVDKTFVQIIADPKIDKNIHEIKASGPFGKFTVTVENEPMPKNAKTSYLAALSILAVLREIGSEVRIS